MPQRKLFFSCEVFPKHLHVYDLITIQTAINLVQYFSSGRGHARDRHYQHVPKLLQLLDFVLLHELNYGPKRRFSGVIWGGLDLVWESATSPTHIWEIFLKNGVFYGSPFRQAAVLIFFFIFNNFHSGDVKFWVMYKKSTLLSYVRLVILFLTL